VGPHAERTTGLEPTAPTLAMLLGARLDLRRWPDLAREQGVLVPMQPHRFASFPSR
jgi:hypothetical protein